MLKKKVEFARRTLPELSYSRKGKIYLVIFVEGYAFFCIARRALPYTYVRGACNCLSVNDLQEKMKKV